MCIELQSIISITIDQYCVCCLPDWQVTEALVQGCEQARKDLEKACEPVKSAKKPKKEKHEAK